MIENTKVWITVNKVICLSCKNIFYESIEEAFKDCPYCKESSDYNFEGEMLDIDLEIDFVTGAIYEAER